MMRSIQTVRHEERGIASIMITVIMIIVITLIVVGFSIISRTELRQSTDDQLSLQAYYAAESGAADAQSQIAKAIAKGDTIQNRTSCSSPALSSSGGGFIYNGGALDSNFTFDSSLSLTNNVSYSCLLVGTTPAEVNYTVSQDNSRVALIQSTKAINQINFSWDDVNTPSNANFQCSPTTDSAQVQFPPTSDWNCDAPVLRLDIVPEPEPTGDGTAVTGNQQTLTLFLHPTIGGSSGAVTAINPTTLASANGQVIPVQCSATSGTRPTQVQFPYDCNFSLQLTGMTSDLTSNFDSDTLTASHTQGNTGYYVRLLPIYNNAQVTISAEPAASGANGTGSGTNNGAPGGAYLWAPWETTMDSNEELPCNFQASDGNTYWSECSQNYLDDTYVGGSGAGIIQSTLGTPVTNCNVYGYTRATGFNLQLIYDNNFDYKVGSCPAYNSPLNGVYACFLSDASDPHQTFSDPNTLENGLWVSCTTSDPNYNSSNPPTGTTCVLAIPNDSSVVNFTFNTFSYVYNSSPFPGGESTPTPASVHGVVADNCVRDTSANTQGGPAVPLPPAGSGAFGTDIPIYSCETIGPTFADTSALCTGIPIGSGSGRGCVVYADNAQSPYSNYQDGGNTYGEQNCTVVDSPYNANAGTSGPVENIYDCYTYTNGYPASQQPVGGVTGYWGTCTNVSATPSGTASNQCFVVNSQDNSAADHYVFNGLSMYGFDGYCNSPSLEYYVPFNNGFLPAGMFVCTFKAANQGNGQGTANLCWSTQKDTSKPVISCSLYEIPGFSFTDPYGGIPTASNTCQPVGQSYTNLGATTYACFDDGSTGFASGTLGLYGYWLPCQVSNPGSGYPPTVFYSNGGAGDLVTGAVGYPGFSAAGGVGSNINIGTAQPYTEGTVSSGTVGTPILSVATDNNILPLENDQIVLDVTGKAQDVLRRIQVRMCVSTVCGGSATNLDYPDDALQSTDSICKQFSIDVNNPGAGTSVGSDAGSYAPTGSSCRASGY